MKLGTASIAAAALLCASITAQASTSSASVQLSNLTFTTIDLVPGDAQLPAYELIPANSTSQVSIFRHSTASTTTQSASGLFAPVSLTLQNGQNASGHASVTATGFEASVTGTDTFDRTSALASGSSLLGGSALIRLAPGTGILVSGNYDIAVSNECAFVHPLCAATVTLDARFLGNGFNSQYDQASFSKSLSISNGSRTLSGIAGATYLNFTDHELDVNLIFQGSATITPVPEPTVVGLMATGLFTVLASRRRSARRSSDSQASRIKA